MQPRIRYPEEEEEVVVVVMVMVVEEEEKEGEGEDLTISDDTSSTLTRVDHHCKMRKKYTDFPPCFVGG